MRIPAAMESMTPRAMRVVGELGWKEEWMAMPTAIPRGVARL
jgi:stage III sporulation protein SpoIIIAA